MSTPINPNESTSSQNFADTPGALPPVSFPAQEGSGVDPTGVWTKFLSTGGHHVTQAQVKQFIDQLCRSMGQHIQNECQRALKALQKAKREINGD